MCRSAQSMTTPRRPRPRLLPSFLLLLAAVHPSAPTSLAAMTPPRRLPRRTSNGTAPFSNGTRTLLLLPSDMVVGFLLV